MPFLTPTSTFGAAPGSFQPMGVPGYTLVPNGGNIFYVRSTGRVAGDPAYVQYILPTLAGALALCRANGGDVIQLLPGHAENVTTTPTFVAGVKIVSGGYGAERATFTWTATTSNWAINVNNVSIQNCVFNMDGAVVATAITVTGTDCSITDNDLRVASSATLLCTLGIDISTGAHRAKVLRNFIRGSNLGLTSAPIRLSGIGVQNVIVDSNNAVCATLAGSNAGTSGAGIIVVSAGTSGGTNTLGPTQTIITNNTLLNTCPGSMSLGSAVGCILIQDTGTALISDGIVANNVMGEFTSNVPGGSAGTSIGTATGLVFSGSNAPWRPIQNFGAMQAQRSGVLTPGTVA